ncbi:hypothetical protein [Amycolatopsis benzoatilytica]|uniref:hypothetical protein n=1 Tax=Amycolatopsis benzoatilytica TaxID=346045 RepID=UPI00037781A5|nr:hypothetical protein [Amycolatopsis benzoatilytica]
MQRTITRILLALLGLYTLVQGLWPLLDPMGFYQDFPGFRHGWVSMDGPYNVHFIIDFGGLSLALGTMLVGAAVMGTTTVARLVSVAALLFAVPHLIYHVGHVGQFPQLDQVLIVGGLAVTVLIPLAALLIPGRRAEVSSSATP